MPLRLFRVRHNLAFEERLAFTKRPKQNSKVDPTRAYLRHMDGYTMQLVFSSAGQARRAAASQIRRLPERAARTCATRPRKGSRWQYPGTVLYLRLSMLRALASASNDRKPGDEPIMEAGLGPSSAINKARDLDEHRLLPRRYAMEKEDGFPLYAVTPRNLYSRRARPQGTVRTNEPNASSNAKMRWRHKKLQSIAPSASALARHPAFYW